MPTVTYMGSGNQNHIANHLATADINDNITTHAPIDGDMGGDILIIKICGLST